VLMNFATSSFTMGATAVLIASPVQERVLGRAFRDLFEVRLSWQRIRCTH
jgi:hypothetical protein